MMKQARMYATKHLCIINVHGPHAGTWEHDLEQAKLLPVDKVGAELCLRQNTCWGGGALVCVGQC